jgi:hypothetical protein
MMCFFKTEAVLELSTLSWVYEHLVIPGVDTERLLSVVSRSSNQLF